MFCVDMVICTSASYQYSFECMFRTKMAMSKYILHQNGYECICFTPTWLENVHFASVDMYRTGMFMSIYPSYQHDCEYIFRTNMTIETQVSR